MQRKQRGLLTRHRSFGSGWLIRSADKAWIKGESRKALYNALICAGIEEEEFDCLFKQYEDGLYHFRVRTFWMNYEFYVDAGSSEVLGMNTEPLVYREDLCLCEPADDALSAVA